MNNAFIAQQKQYLQDKTRNSEVKEYIIANNHKGTFNNK